MIKDKKQIHAMIYRYLTDEKGIKTLGFISYHAFNKELIAEEFELINDFFRENFDLNHPVIKYGDLLKDSNGEAWLEIKDIFDLELLDELIAFGIAANVFNENLIYRFEDTVYYPEDLQHYDKEGYLRIMKEMALPLSRLEVSDNTINRYCKIATQSDYSLQRKKELLLSWWESGMKDEDDEETRRVFVELLESEYITTIIYLIHLMYLKNETSLKIAELIKNKEIMRFLNFVGAIYFRISPEDKEELFDSIREMFNKLSNLYQKKKRLN